MPYFAEHPHWWSEENMLQNSKISCPTHITIRDRHPLRFNSGSSGYSWGEAIQRTWSLLQWHLAIREIEAMWDGPASIWRGHSVHGCYHVTQFSIIIRVQIHPVSCVSTHDCPVSVWAAYNKVHISMDIAESSVLQKVHDNIKLSQQKEMRVEFDSNNKHTHCHFTSPNTFKWCTVLFRQQSLCCLNILSHISGLKELYCL